MPNNSSSDLHSLGSVDIFIPDSTLQLTDIEKYLLTGFNFLVPNAWDIYIPASALQFLDGVEIICDVPALLYYFLFNTPNGGSLRQSFHFLGRKCSGHLQGAKYLFDLI